MLNKLKRLFSNDSYEEDSIESENELWIMIKENSCFREEAHLKIIDELAEIIEGKNFGELDGHSSGAYQFEINFYGVNKYEKCKKIVTNFMFSKYPDLEYTVSKEYETTYEKKL
ncbi:MAG: hypothetical protein ACRBEE_00005 [Arenicella sp.]